MSAFFLFHNKQVRDPAELAEYKAGVAPVVAAYGGRYRASSAVNRRSSKATGARASS
jgi:uncharacterized protein (DUF1330 family)